MTGTSKTTYSTTKILNLLRATNYTAPANVYVGLFTVMPADDGTGGTEVTTVGTAYVRQAITFGAPAAVSPTGMIVKNTAAVNFPTATADYGTCIGFGIWDAAAAGNMIYYALLAQSLTILNGQTRGFDVGDLTVSED